MAIAEGRDRQCDGPQQVETPKVLVKGKGGLGNRLLCAAGGILWGRASKASVCVDWRDGAYGEIGTNSYYALFSDAPGWDVDSIAAAGSVTPSVWQDRLHLSVAELMEELDPRLHRSVFASNVISVRPCVPAASGRISVYWDYTDRVRESRRLLAGERGSAGYWDILGNYFLRDLTLQGQLEREFLSWREGLIDPWGAVVGMHIRASDRMTPIGKLIESAKREVRRVRADAVFLATDNREVERAVSRELRNVQVLPKWLPSKTGSPAHQSVDYASRHRNGEEALLDIWLLSHCRSIIFCRRSTFGVVAALRGRSRGASVVDVDRWNPRVAAAGLAREVAKRIDPAIPRLLRIAPGW